LIEHKSHHDVGAFTAHSGQVHQRLPIIGHLSTVTVDQLLAHEFEITGLVVVHAGRPYQGFQLFYIQVQDLARSACHGKQIPAGFGGAFVSCLRTQGHAHQALECTVVDLFSGWVVGYRILGMESAVYFCDLVHG
jgi:hypothetical protein